MENGIGKKRCTAPHMGQCEIRWLNVLELHSNKSRMLTGEL
ncbi:MAG TPA: hypothetical protein VIH18_02415 [Candidatus Binatia bacterium]|jgi:hypothetical protein